MKAKEKKKQKTFRSLDWKPKNSVGSGLKVLWTFLNVNKAVNSMWKRNWNEAKKNTSTWAGRLNVEKWNTEAKSPAKTDTSKDDTERKRKIFKISSIDKALKILLLSNGILPVQ